LVEVGRGFKMKKLLNLLFTVFLLAIPTQSAFAHAFVTDSFPKVNTSVSQIPSRVWIEFDGNLAVFDGHEVNKLFVYDSNGNRIDDGKILVGGARISVGIKVQARGQIRMSYRVVSDDGHPVENELFFNSNFPLESKTPESKSSANTKAPTNVIKVKETPKASGDKSVKIDTKKPESLLKEHLPHLIQFLFAAFLIFVWSLVRKKRNN
jgi:methionine-rich copper-binding protein CopC